MPPLSLYFPWIPLNSSWRENTRKPSCPSGCYDSHHLSIDVFKPMNIKTFILLRISKDWSHHQSLRMLTLFPLYCKHFTLYLQSMGTFFWDYLVNSYSGIRITEHTEYQFPKEQTLCYSENRIADVTNVDVMRPEKSGYAIFPPKDRQKLPQEHDYWLFCLFQTIHYSVNSAELTEYYSVYSGIRIGPKRTQLLQFCVFSFQNSPKRMCPM